MESYQDLIDELLTVKFGKSSRQMNCVTELSDICGFQDGANSQIK